MGVKPPDEAGADIPDLQMEGMEKLQAKVTSEKALGLGGSQGQEPLNGDFR